MKMRPIQYSHNMLNRMGQKSKCANMKVTTVQGRLKTTLQSLDKSTQCSMPTTSTLNSMAPKASRRRMRNTALLMKMILTNIELSR